MTKTTNNTGKLIDFLQQNQPTSEQMLSNIVSKRLSLQDPDLPAFLAVEEIKGKLQAVLLHSQEFREASSKEIALLRAEIKQLGNSKATVPSQKVARKTIKIPNVDFLLKLFAAMIFGTIVSGVASFFYFVPNEIKAQRGKDLESLTFINSDDGIAFKKMVELNKGYFPDKCRENAKNKGISIIFKGKKEENVCVLRIP